MMSKESLIGLSSISKKSIILVSLSSFLFIISLLKTLYPLSIKTLDR